MQRQAGGDVVTVLLSPHGSASQQSGRLHMEGMEGGVVYCTQVPPYLGVFCATHVQHSSYITKMDTYRSIQCYADTLLLPSEEQLRMCDW
jgi:hypothetical protein